MSTYMKKYYMNTLSRASPFCVGMVFGYWLHVCRERPLVLRRVSEPAFIIQSLLTSTTGLSSCMSSENVPNQS